MTIVNRQLSETERAAAREAHDSIIDGRPAIDRHYDALLFALWQHHGDKMPKRDRLRWEADHDYS